MQKSLMKLLGVAVLTWSSQISAVSMGGINVSSTLGQPLKASIPLDSVSEAEKSGLTARLASAEAYKSAGLEYPLGITFKFEIDANTRHITVISNQSINIPFVSLLIELNWASGKLVRDYTFLIDPPGYTPEPTPLPAVQPIAPDTQAGSSVLATTPDTQAASAVPATPIMPAEVESHPIGSLDTQIEKIVQPVKVAKPHTETVKIQRGDTLNKIAAQNKPAEVSLDRMMVALYRANAQKFVGKNMNRVKTGTILRLPSQQEIDNVSATEARKEIHAQAKDWNAYRQQLASNTTVSSQSDNTQQSSTGKLSTDVTDKTPVANDSAKEVLKLSSGNAPDDKTATAQDQQNAAQEDAIAKSKAAQEEQTRAALAAKNAHDAQQLLELKSQAGMLASSAALAASSVSGIVTAISAPASAVTVDAASAVVDAMSAIHPVLPSSAAHPVAKPVEPPAQPETSLVDDVLAAVSPVLDEPLYLAGGAAILFGLGGLVFALNRRKQHPKSNEDADSASALATAFDHPDEEAEVKEEEESEESVGEATARFYQTQNAASYQPVVHEEIEEDPIEEARLFLSFGRDAQAEDILKDALKKTPHHYQLHLELLGIYVHRKDVNAFAAVAKQIKDADDETLWAQAAALGRKIDPSNAMYADGKVSGTPALHLPATPEPAHSLDFDLGISTNKSLIPKLDATSQHLPDLKDLMNFESDKPAASQPLPSSIDLHVATAEHQIMSGELANLGDMIYDVTAKHQALTATGSNVAAGELPSMDQMMFDITSAHTALGGAPQAPAPVVEKDAPMTFSMDFSLPDMKSVPAPAAAPADKTDMPFTIDFAMPNLPSAATSLAPVSASMDADAMPFTIDLAMPEVAPTAPASTKPPVTMDFSLTEVPPVASSSPAIKLDFGDINLNMGGTAEAAGSANNAAFQEVANKLDLAKVYIEMDDAAAAREFLEEVLREGNAEQISSAKAMLNKLG